MGTSLIKSQLLGDTAAYSALLEPLAKKLAAACPDAEMQRLFEALPHRLITLAPMVICDRLVRDLGGTADDLLLQALGVMCYHISTHDDLIDEPPAGRCEQGALLYAGNIAFIEGCNLLLNVMSPEQAQLVWAEVARNHVLQQRCVTALWENMPRSFSDYRHGVEHAGVFVGVSVRAALAVTGRQELWPRLQEVCANYGMSLQLLDDILEVDEDRAAGYHSSPLMEGPPYRRSFRQLLACVDKGKRLSGPQWPEFRQLFDNMRDTAERLRATL